MKHNNFYHIAYTIALILLFTQACGSSNIDLEITPAAQAIEASEAVGTDEVPQEVVTPTVEPTSTSVATNPAMSTPTSTATSKPFHIESASFEFEGQERNYMVFIPDTYTDSQNYPMVIYLHSYGWTAQQGMDYTQLNQVANSYNFMVVYPSARRNWNSGMGDNSGVGTPNHNDVGFIDVLIDMLSMSYSIDLDRIYAAGYSNGGFMAYKLACQLSHRIAAVASVGGVISTSTLADCNPLRPIPILQIHGTEDSWVPIEGKTGWNSVDQTLKFWTNINDCDKADSTIIQDTDSTDGCTVEKISYTNCTDNSIVIYYKVINGGHTWPGAGPTGYSAGNTNQDLNASVEIWNFFKGYQLTPVSIESIENDGSP